MLRGGIKLAKTMATIDPDSSYAYRFQGVFLYYDDRLEEAKRVMEECSKRFPALVEPHRYLAHIYMDLGTLEQAQKSVAHALSLIRPGDVYSSMTVNTTLGMLRERQGRLDEAEAAYRTAFDLSKTHYSKWDFAGLVLAGFLAKQDRCSEAIEVYCETIPRIYIRHHFWHLRRFSSCLRRNEASGPSSCLHSLATYFDGVLSGDVSRWEVLEAAALTALRTPGEKDHKKALAYARQAVEITERENSEVMATLVAVEQAMGLEESRKTHGRGGTRR